MKRYSVGIGIWLFVMGTASEVTSQPVQPVGPYVIDVHGSLARFKEDAAIAATIDVEPDNLPTRGLGLTTGAHWYPVRWRRVALGLGAELLFARDSRTREPTDSTTTTTPPPSTPATTTANPTVTTRLSSFSPQLSLNFGKGDGWSYISGGIGWARLTAERQDVPAEGADRSRSTNYGAGARWFTSPHLAFSFDVRFYAINARPATPTQPQFPRNRLMVISAGISMK